MLPSKWDYYLRVRSTWILDLILRFTLTPCHFLFLFLFL
jgi:hypothetical protein